MLHDPGTSALARLLAQLSGDLVVAYAYRAQRLEAAGVSLAMGRDLSAQSALQQRLLQAQREAYSSSPAVSPIPKRRSLT